MSYSRSRTQQMKKSQRRSRAKKLIIVNTVLLVCLLAIIGVIWYSYWDKGDPSASPGKPQANSVSPPPSGTSAAQTQEPSAPSSTDPVETAVPTPPPEEQSEEQSTPPEGEGGKVTLALVGDILPAARVLELMKQNGFDYPFREVKRYLEEADIAAGNLETPITTRGTPAENKSFVFRGTPDTVPALKEAGFDFLSLANNHTLDYGWVGLRDTMGYLDDANLQYAGSGSDDKEAFAPAYIIRDGITVGFVSLTRVVPEVEWKADRNTPGVAEAYSTERAVAAIKDARSNADVVVVMVHWGEERHDTPNQFQKNLAYTFVDAGADLVIGSHPHVLQGFEHYKGKWIAYSLGNFVFSMTSWAKSAETGILQAECGNDGSCGLKLLPLLSKNSQPAPMEPEAGKALLKRISDLSISAYIEEDGTIVARQR